MRAGHTIFVVPFHFPSPDCLVSPSRVPVCTPAGVARLMLCFVVLLTIGCAKKPEALDEARKLQTPLLVPGGKAWALIIGIEQYEHGGLVRYAQADAKSMEDVLTGQGFTLTALYDKQATKTAIESTLDEILTRRAGPDDRVVIFFAGRGETRSASDGKKDFLLPVEVEPADIERTAVSLDRVRASIESSAAKQVMLIAATNLGSFEGRPVQGEADLRPETVRSLMTQRGAQVITAAASDQKPLDVAEWNHSLFTHYLLEGLSRAEADANRDGVVHASELFIYLEQNVLVASQIRGHTQHPQFHALTDGAGEIVFVPARPREEVPAVLPDTPGSFAVRELELQLRGLEQNVEELEALRPKGPPADEAAAAIVRRLNETKKQTEAIRALYLQARLLAGHDVVGQDGARMIMIPAGEFLMGESTRQYAVADPAYNYAPLHRVYVDGFYIDKHEVTVSLYTRFLEETVRPTPRFWSEMKPERDGQRPVIGVSWDDAVAYCGWAGKRLPTEAEWEKAARGTDGRKYPWGNDEPKRSLASYDWYGVRTWQGYQSLSPVGSYEAGKSPYGVHDMAGSVWEWVSDWYSRNYYEVGPKQNPKGPEKGRERVVRGGSWRHPPELLRVAYRHRYQPTVLPFSYLGFRCAQDLPKPGERLGSVNAGK